MHAVNGCIGADGRLSYTLSISAVYTGVSQKRGMDTAPIVYDLGKDFQRNLCKQCLFIDTFASIRDLVLWIYFL